MASADLNNANKVEPVFFLNNEVYEEAGKWLDTLEVCLAVCEVVSDENCVEGAQRIGGLWRVYITNLEARIQLLSTGINIRGCQITLKDKNPFINVLGREDVDTTRVYVRNIPLSYDNGEIEKALKSKSVQLLGPIKYVRARTKEGKLTNFKTGDRFVDIITPKEPLPKKIGMGIFTASVYHKEQKQSRADIECGNCKQSGHIRRDCPNQPVCYDCSQPGHRRGSENCPETHKKFEGTAMQTTQTALEAHEELQEEEEEVDSEEEEDDDEEEEETDSAERIGSGLNAPVQTLKASASNSTSRAHEHDTSAKGKQTLISKLWNINNTNASPVNSPGTSPISSPLSSPRTRKLQDRSPEENVGKEKKSKKKKK